MTGYRAAVAAAVALLALAGCGSPGHVDNSDARPVTAEESQALAMTRVRNLDAGTRTVAFELEERGAVSAFDGWFDYASGTGYGTLTEGDTSALVLWNHTVFAAAPADGDPPPPPAGPLDPSWRIGPFDPSSSRAHTVLAVVAALGSDRPENPLLLSGSGALWLADRTLSGTDLMVLAGPPSDEALAPGETADPEAATVRYWIEPTGLAHRVDVRMGADAWVEVSFGTTAEEVRIADPFGTEGAP